MSGTPLTWDLAAWAKTVIDGLRVVDWATLVKTVLGAGVGTLIVQAWRERRRDRRQRKEQAAYMAMRLAVALEFYALSLSEFISNNQNASNQPHPDTEFPDWNKTLPELPPYPDNADDWRAINRGLAGRCLNLRNEIYGSQNLIDYVKQYSPDDLGDTLNEQAAKRGLEAWKLAVALRCEHGVEKIDTVWNYPDQLESTLRGIEKEKGKNRKRTASEMADLLPNANDPPAPKPPSS
jgi:hypothetical protein